MFNSRKVKILLGLAIIIFLPIFGFGCKGMTTQEQQATKAVSLEWWTVYDDVDALNQLIVGYKASRPYLTVNIRQLRADELYQRLIEELADGRGPDIISVSNRDLRKYISKLSIMPSAVRDTTVQTVASRFGSTTNVTIGSVVLPTVDVLDREYVQTVKKDVMVDGKIYGLPLSLDTMAIYYNKDILDAAGVALPPTTWEEFQTAVKKITRLNKDTNKFTQSGTALGTGNNVSGVDDILYMLFSQSQVPFVADNGRANLAAGGKNAQSVMNFYTDFANPTRDTYSWNEEAGVALDKFISGNVAFFFGYSFHLPIIRARAPQLNLGVLPMIQLSPDSTAAKNVASYSVETVLAKSTNPNEAWALINYLSHTKANGDYLTTTKRPTALRAYISKQKEDLDLQPFVDQILVANNWYRGRNYDAALRALKDMCHDWINPPANLNEDKVAEYRQNLLNSASEKINQTL